MKCFYRLMVGRVCLLLLLLAVLSASTVFGGTSAVSEILENAEKVLVSRVVDSDTIQLDDGRRVRLIGVDTPETVHPQKGVEPYGKEASNFTHSMLEGREVYLEYDVQLTDKFGRTLA